MSVDVAVLGAGPAGAWTARALAARGARVLLVDPSHPREKPCGGGVTGRALALIPAAIAEEIPCSAIRRARFVDSSSARSAAVPLDVPAVEFPPDLVVASRTEFDAALLRAACEAGVQHLGARVVEVAAARGGFRIDTTAGSYHAPWIVGADGANSLVRRRVASPFRRDQLSIATGYYAPHETGDEIVIELTDDPPGYLWSFPRPTHLAVGVCAQADAGVGVDALRAATRTWIARHRLAATATLKPYSWPIPSLSATDFGELRVSGPGWLLVGDAAGLVDPITREGIYFALASAQFAAEALATGGAYVAERYEDLVFADAVPELARAAAFKARFFRPEFIRLLMRAIGRSASIRRVLADLIAGRQRYETLAVRLLRTFEVRLAFDFYRQLVGS